MNLPAEELLPRLRADPSYERAFTAIYAEGLTRAAVGRALAAFQRSIVSTDSPFDRFVAGDDAALAADARRGLALFVGKARCSKCHDGVNLTDESFHNVGVQTDDIGRGKFDGENFNYAFRTPGLRNVALTAPYKHNGAEATLAEVVAFYDRGGDRREGIDPEMKPLDLSDGEKGDLVAFLESLTGATASAIPGAAKLGQPGQLFGQFQFSKRPPRAALIHFVQDTQFQGDVVVDQNNKRFLAGIAVGGPGAAIEFKNSDTIRHNIYADDDSAGVRFDLGLADPGTDWKKRQTITWKPGQVVELGCKVHPSMSTYIASANSRYHAALQFDGPDTLNFELDAPQALTDIAVWLPGYDPIEASIEPGQRLELELRRNGRVQGSLVLGRF